MNKAERLELLRNIGNRHQELRQDRREILFAPLPVGTQEIQETVADMDTFREEQRQNRGEFLTSDET
jgi:hypothetical protein